jgi:hypothetical protein
MLLALCAAASTATTIHANCSCGVLNKLPSANHGFDTAVPASPPSAPSIAAAAATAPAAPAAAAASTPQRFSGPAFAAAFLG